MNMRSTAKRVIHAGLPVPGFVRPAIKAAYHGGVFFVESLAFLRKLFWVEPVLRSVCEHVGSGLRAERLPYMRGQGRMVLGDRVNLSGRSCFYFMHGMPEPGLISIGDDTFVGDACTFSCAREIRVGCHCLIASCVRVHDNDGHPVDPERRRRNDPLRADESAMVTIGDNVWLGAGVTVLKGVSIGDNSVVGTGSVVTSDVPPDTVVAGSPARVVRKWTSRS